MDIRLAQAEEKQQVKQLWQACFNDVQAYVDWFFNEVFKPENCLVAVERGRVLCAAQLLPYNLYIRGASVQASYIVGVSTWPDVRRKGIASKIMSEAVSVSRSRGRLFNLLYPSIDGYYERFGYVPASYYAECSFDAGLLGGGSFDGSLIAAEDGDIPLLNEIYEGYMSVNGVYLKRDKHIWQNTLRDFKIAGGGAYIVKATSGEACGYLLYTKPQHQVKIAEAGYTTQEGYNGIRAFIASNAPLKAVLRTHLRDRALDFMYGHSYDIAVKLGAMFQTVDRPAANALYTRLFGDAEDLMRLDDAAFTRAFFGKAGGGTGFDNGVYISLAGWN